MPTKDHAHPTGQSWEGEHDIQVSMALFGQPGSGKSSLINRLTGQNLAETGVETDKTLTAESYAWNGIHLVDLPGYDTKRFPKEQYFARFNIETFDLFLCVFSEKFRQADSQLFQELQKIGKICLFVRNKSDTIWDEGHKTQDLHHKIQKDVRKHVNAPVRVYFTSCRKRQGLKDLIQGISENLADAKRERWIQAAKAYSAQFLKAKKKICQKQVQWAAAAAAVNGINPIPGVNVGVDVSILLGLFASIRKTYELTEQDLLKVQEMAVPALAHVAKNVVNFGTKAGLMLLLQKYAKREIIVRLGAYIPVVGQAIAATAGFVITRQAGLAYLNDCHTLASEILARQAEMRYQHPEKNDQNQR